ncbi:MAG TPA: PilZ domain-containing protein [Gammaproteobacteria bacterium]|nr:PilZ domain-containing protein [Gammaproteobacteria bacterium]
MVDSPEKRSFIRMNIEARAVFKVNGGEKKQEGRLTDLSATGFSLMTDLSLKNGDELEIRVTPEKAIVSPLHASARVLRVDKAADSPGYRLGCEIMEMLD